jgi:hypothetical protein
MLPYPAKDFNSMRSHPEIHLHLSQRCRPRAWLHLMSPRSVVKCPRPRFCIHSRCYSHINFDDIYHKCTFPPRVPAYIFASTCIADAVTQGSQLRGEGPSSSSCHSRGGLPPPKPIANLLQSTVSPTLRKLFTSRLSWWAHWGSQRPQQDANNHPNHICTPKSCEASRHAESS